MRDFRRRHRATEARLEKVNRALTRLDGWEAAQAMPAKIRPPLEKPTLGRKALESLQEMLEERLRELEVMWERRN